MNDADAHKADSWPQIFQVPKFYADIVIWALYCYVGTLHQHQLAMFFVNRCLVQQVPRGFVLLFADSEPTKFKGKQEAESGD